MGPLTAEAATALPGPGGDEIRIALVLPLMLPAQLGSAFKPSQTMAEFCTAARLAEADAQAKGVPLKLYFYDSRRAVDSANGIANLPELAGMDLVVGPIYGKETAALAAWAQARQVPMVNPLTTALHFEATNKFAYQAEPGPREMAAAALALKQVGPGKQVGCIYGTAPKDSALAAAFAEQARQAGHTLALFKKVAKNSAANLPKFLREAGLDSNSVLFVPNTEPLVKAQLLSALEITRCPALTVTYGAWIEESDIPLERFERLRIRFLYPDYPGYGLPEAEALRGRIQEAYGLPATDVGLKAYDLIAVLGQALAQAAPQARSSALRDYSPLPSKLTAGYDFTQSQINTRVPIYRLYDGRLERE